ncbi:hypothetical protein CEE69_30065 [Rhodopirellula bahusiensis]|uniref:Uncharacterized protein n=1 Tax=Rhodopirellula bahusiensis TaxID=2014065 RepID=A0A2G1VXV2_9BACT|nr:hypothetical protein CEE69_30065 [Rhodopirellula bahusiensis]
MEDFRETDSCFQRAHILLGVSTRSESWLPIPNASQLAIQKPIGSLASHLFVVEMVNGIWIPVVVDRMQLGDSLG